MVARRLNGESAQFLQAVVDHGIHNLTNDYHGRGQSDYDAYSETFERIAKKMLGDMGL
jgi:hypothetical protein